MADLCAQVSALPAGLCGVVYRHDSAPERAQLGRALARLCRARRIRLVVAGDARLAARLGAGVHLRGGRWPGSVRCARGFCTASAHSQPELARARRMGARVIFLSPVFATRSHPGAPGLGAYGFRRLARAAPGHVACALGGVNGANVRRLGKACRGVGAIEALLETRGPTQAR